MTTYKLIDAIKERQKIQVARRKNGVVQYMYASLEPGVAYEAEEDPLFINSLLNAKVKKTFSDALEAELKAQGIQYSVERARCCGGRRRVLSYGIVEVMTDNES